MSGQKWKTNIYCFYYFIDYQSWVKYIFDRMYNILTKGDNKWIIKNPVKNKYCLNKTWISFLIKFNYVV